MLTDRASKSQGVGDSRGRAVSFRTLVLSGLALAALIAAVTGVLFVRFVQYERVAARHVPDDTSIAIRLDVSQASLYAPFRRHLLPLLGSLEQRPEAADARLARMEKSAKVGRADLREALLAFASSGEWTVVLAGKFRPDVGALLRALSAEEPHWVRAGDAILANPNEHVALGVAPDGAIVLSVDESRVRMALPARAQNPSLGGTGGGFFAAGASIGSSGTVSGGAAGALSRWLASVRLLEGHIDLGERISLAVTATPVAGREPLNLASQGLEILRSFPTDESSPWGTFARRGGDRGSVSREGPAAPQIILVWETEELDRIFEAGATYIRGVLPRPTG